MKSKILKKCRIITTICFMVVLIALFSANVSASYQSGTNNGYFWALDNDQGGYIIIVMSGGNYSVSWNYNETLLVVGMGYGSSNRVMAIIVYYSCNGGGVYYYGWSDSWSIVMKNGGSGRQQRNSFRSVNSDGGSYDIYTSMRYNAPSIDGNQTFRQIYSTNITEFSWAPLQITFANHYNA